MATEPQPSWTARHDGLVRSGWAPLVALASRLVDRAEAEDVVQESLARLAVHPVRDRPDDEVMAWLRRVSLNLATNRLRDVGRWRARASLTGPEGGADDPLCEVLRSERRAEVRHVLLGLPDKQRACLLLRHSGLRYAEIADALDMPVTSVGTTLARAERAFRAHYEGRAQHEGRAQDERRTHNEGEG